MLKVKCMLDTKQYNNKPQGSEAGAIQNRLENAQVEINLQDLALQLAKGCTFKPALLSGRKDEHWIQQQLIGLDFDGGTTIESELNRCEQLGVLPVFGYTTFSHTEDEHKFRLVFCLDEIIHDRDRRDKLVTTLVKQVFTNSDEVVFNAGRLFYGGRNLIPLDYDNRINAKDILEKYYVDELPDVKVNKFIHKSVKADVLNSTTNLHIEAIKSLDSDTMKTLVNVDSIMDWRNSGKIEEYIYNTILSFHQKPPLSNIATTRMEVYEIINKIDLADFLGIDSPESFCCIIHDDHNPSAGIFKGKDGSDIYKCFSSNCGFVGSIVKIVEKLAGCNKVKAINFIKSIYNIELIQSDWQKEQIELIEVNKDYLYSGKMEEEYPQLWKYVKPRLSKVICLLDLAAKNCYDEDMSYMNNPVFWASTSHLKEIFDTSSNETVSKSINLFALTDMVHKLSEDNIPENMLKKAKHYAANKGYKKLPNHFTVPSYDENTLKDSESKANLLIENNFSMKGMSREWIMRTFGLEVANKVYPQYKFENERGVSKKSDNKTDAIVLVIFELINQQGYVKESQVVEVLRSTYGKNGTEIQIKRSLQEILDGYDLKRIRANKLIKEQLGIVSNGYPFLLVKNVA